MRGRRKVGPAAGGVKKASKKAEVAFTADPHIANEEEDEEAQKAAEFPRLAPAELNMTFTRSLVVRNPQAEPNRVMYDYLERKNRANDGVDQLVMHFALEGDFVHTSSNEYKMQEEIEYNRKTKFESFRRQAEQEEAGSGKNVEAIKQAMRNKFDYKSREVQTIYSQIRERAAATCPPVTDNLRGEITQWEVWDSYVEEFKKENKDQAALQRTNAKSQGRYSASFRRCMKIMERMIRQNQENTRYNDYRYYWQEGQQPNGPQGELLPIWRLFFDKKKKQVTSIAWNPRYADLFAVSLGSYDFAKQKAGQILVWSLKNVAHPQYKYESLPTGVMCLDWHPSSPALLAAGLYDGTVLVYDVRNKHSKPIYESTVRTLKHTDPVWQIRWSPDTSEKYNFYSISSDGRVMNWSLMKNKLQPQEVFRLKLTGEKEEESNFIGLACGHCFDFSRFDAFSFLVGTEEGKIHKCSLAYSGQYQETYKGHLLAVYKVRWNHFHPSTFISASADWTVRIWDATYPQAQVMLFDMGMIVVDAMWAPYSSTVFACATLDRIYLYDLNVQKHKSLADKKPVKNPKLTNLAFNPTHPIVLLGDSFGAVTVIKLSPNLLKRGPQPKKKEENQKTAPPPPTPQEIKEFQRKKMDDLIMLVSKWDRE